MPLLSDHGPLSFGNILGPQCRADVAGYGTRWTEKVRKMKKAHVGSVYRKDKKLAVFSVSRIEGLANTEKTSYFYPPYIPPTDKMKGSYKMTVMAPVLERNKSK